MEGTFHTKVCFHWQKRSVPPHPANRHEELGCIMGSSERIDPTQFGQTAALKAFLLLQ